MAKTIKIIDLYILIANKEFDKLPKKFTYEGYLWEYDVKNKMWFYYFGENKNHRFDRLFYINQILNDKVKILEEEKKIPEKLNIEQNSIGNHYIKNEFGTQCNLTKHSKIIADKINEILDYLETKGDE